MAPDSLLDLAFCVQGERLAAVLSACEMLGDSAPVMYFFPQVFQLSFLVCCCFHFLYVMGLES